MSSCREIDPLIQLFVDGEINFRERQILGEHIKVCSSCREQLNEMIVLVQGLEEIGVKERRRQKQLFLQPVKWAALCTSIILLAFVSPVHSVPSSNKPLHETETAGKDQPQEMLAMMTVLATQGEKLHIPDDEYIHVVQPRQIDSPPLSQTALIYPSAMPFFKHEQQPWLKKINQFVFVKVPDVRTLHTLLTTTGIRLEPDQLVEGQIEFPASMIIKTGENPQIETFQFPDNEQGISHWFNKMASQSALH
ncbi:zf-HC2 domain-containing protein [Paenactinomyces guangxiensis]|uniref:Zf-HC2 domain-containing protein n=2 Tax=Paenactinomyces guangxiensis TaxID=1490290 RepID=A0A7W2A769_9BACL|nr:zf-HC2 domain-containing protein [Paenactinomyces guangxiensis]MBA4492827.1 zf-HC2 domain-containing protein [Paenactinomyces guangxiensis]MBH8590324.1 zf-HC2 domain-containing protein [Paenactinomyces guangxiensis]